MALAMNFIVRVAEDEDGRLGGVVVRVRTGEQERFEGIEDITRVIAGMLSRDTARTGGPTP